MPTLLINGCSFTRCWTPSNEFVKLLGCDQTINLGKNGGSFQRVARTTVEFLTQNNNNNKKYIIIVPITYAHRWELSISKNDDSIDGTWYPMQIKKYLEKEKISNLVDFKKLETLIDLYYGCIPDIRTYWDRCFTDIILLSSFLDQHKIDYLMFDMCNNFEMHHLKGYKGFEKIDLIKKNKKIIDLFSFCGNRYMWNNMTEEEKKRIDPYAHHHTDNEYNQLEKYLLNYRTLHF